VGEGGDRRDIMKNYIYSAELKKLNTRFYSEVLRKKWFVLYEDSLQSLSKPRPARDPNADTSGAGANGHVSDDEDLDGDDYEPARLEYYNKKRNWEAGERPRKTVILKDVFSITRKKDTKESIHKYVIAIYTVEDCLGIGMYQ
jgi:hypothetical protein